MYKTMEFILGPSKIDAYPHNNIANRITWDKKYMSLLSAQFIVLGLVGNGHVN